MNLWPVLEWLVDEQPVAAAREAANHSRREWHSGLSEKDSSLNAADTVNSLVSPCFSFFCWCICVCVRGCVRMTHTVRQPCIDNIPKERFFKPRPSRLCSSKPAVKCGWFFQLFPRLEGGGQSPFSIETSRLQPTPLSNKHNWTAIYFPNMHHGALILYTENEW